MAEQVAQEQKPTEQIFEAGQEPQTAMPKKKSKWWIWLIVVIVVLVVGAGIYWFFLR